LPSLQLGMWAGCSARIRTSSSMTCAMGSGACGSTARLGITLSCATRSRACLCAARACRLAGEIYLTPYLNYELMPKTVEVSPWSKRELNILIFLQFWPRPTIPDYPPPRFSRTHLSHTYDTGHRAPPHHRRRVGTQSRISRQAQRATPRRSRLGADGAGCVI